MKFLVLLGLIYTINAVTFLRAPNPDDTVPNSYLVVFKNSIDDELVEKYFAFTTQNNIHVKSQFSIGDFKGASVVLTDSQLEEHLTFDATFAYIEEDQVVSIAQSCNIQSNTPSWGLPRTSSKTIQQTGAPYDYPDHEGEGVTSYIVDTGIYLDHEDFGGRARFGINVVDDGKDEDCNGHGTHVAGTVGGTTYGIAKKVTLIAVKVLGCAGSGSISGIISALDWVTNHAQSKSKSNVNMSLGGGLSTVLNNAVTAVVNAGISVIVAAGNSNANACSSSPSSAAGVISVGATDINDNRATFSNFGTCVHVFGPGVGITSAWIGNPTAKNTISGTSMASPHVAGVVSLLQHGDSTPDELRQIIQKTGLPAVKNPGTGSPTLLLHHECV